ncbi:MAG: 4Fe-4S binding protein, partial [Defluviitaleaceae bacterium]|nr:4Fe-4S binding protein [Defluviitaleaceae bacterium]
FNETKAPGIIKKFLSRFVQTRPFVNSVLCSGCGVCKESCPAGIIKIDGSKAKIDYKTCIRCYCCQELCPQKSVGIKRPPLSYLMRL